MKAEALKSLGNIPAMKGISLGKTKHLAEKKNG
jgi:hypothetical protein